MAILTSTVLLSVAGCGGGGGSLTPSTRIPVPAVTQTSAANAKTANVAFTVMWPKASAAAANRGRKYLSNSTASVAITVNGGVPVVLNNPNLTPGTTKSTTQTSTANLAAPVGSDTFVVSAFDAMGGSGNLLGGVTTMQTVTLDQANVVEATLDGNLAKIAIAYAANALVSGTFPAYTVVGQAPQDFVLTPEDADGNIIISPGTVPSLTLSSASPASISETATETANEYAIQSHVSGVTITLTAAGSNLAGNAVATDFTVTTVADPTQGWSVVPSQNVASYATNGFNGVACAGPSECFVVGQTADASGNSKTLVEQWNGASWSIVPSPNAPVSYNTLNAVACSSANSCLAVGYDSAGSSGVELVLAERWDGSSWSIVPTQDVSSPQQDALFGASCVTDTDCWAVGQEEDATTGFLQTLTEHWNGSAFTVVTSADSLPIEDNSLSGVSCVSTSDCWAVGSHKDPTNMEVGSTVIEQWNGSSWQIATSPNTSPLQDNILASVSCASASDCWAVGNYVTGSVGNLGNSQNLVERYDGTSWSMGTVANASTTESNYLKGVTCPSATQCYAVGLAFTATGLDTLVELWNGSMWSILTSSEGNADPASYSFLEGVACYSPDLCFAAGYYLEGTIVSTLIESPDFLNNFASGGSSHRGTDTLHK